MKALRIVYVAGVLVIGGASWQELKRRRHKRDWQDWLAAGIITFGWPVAAPVTWRFTHR